MVGTTNKTKQNKKIKLEKDERVIEGTNNCNLTSQIMTRIVFVLMMIVGFFLKNMIFRKSPLMIT